MNFSIISDLHIKSEGDDRYKLLMSFLNSQEVEDSDIIILLGDIFDLLIGPHLKYVEEYKEFFEKFKKLLKVKKIWWFEGNHDFHFEKLISKVLTQDLSDNFEYIKKEKILSLNGKKIYLAHGDHLDIENESYMKYKNIVRSDWARVIIENLLPYTGLKFLKDKFSNQSKKMQKEFNKNKEREKFRRYVKNLQAYDLVVLGHSHIFEHTEGYINLGFPEVDKKFLFFNGNINLVDLK